MSTKTETILGILARSGIDVQIWRPSAPGALWSVVVETAEHPNALRKFRGRTRAQAVRRFRAYSGLVAGTPRAE